MCAVEPTEKVCGIITSIRYLDGHVALTPEKVDGAGLPPINLSVASDIETARLFDLFRSSTKILATISGGVLLALELM